MPKELNKIINEIFVDTQINQLRKTELEIKEILGKSFLQKHVKKIFLQNNKIVIQTKNIEAKTELNIIKKNFNTRIKLL